MADLPDALREIVVGAYNDALTPVFLMLVPLVAVGFVLLLFVKEAPLRATLEPVEDDGVDAPVVAG